MPLLDATIRQSPVDPRFALTVAVDESGRTEAMSDIPDIQHQAYKYGVIGRSVEAAGKLAADVHEGYQLGKHGAGVSKILDPIQEDLLKISQLEEDVNGLQRQRRMAASREEISRIEPELVNKLDELRKAQEQGSISSKDALLRVKALTRNAVNNNPGYASRIVNYTGDLLWASGIREVKDPYIDIDKANRAAAKEKREHIAAQAKLYGVAYDPDDLHTEEGQRGIIEAYTKRAEAKQMSTDVLNQDKLQKAVDLSTAPKRAKHASDLKEGHQLNIDEGLNTLYDALDAAKTETDKKAILLQYNSVFENHKETIRRDFIDKGFPIKEVKEHIKDLEDYHTNQEKIINERKAGKLSNKGEAAAKNLQKVIQNAKDNYGLSKETEKWAKGLTPQTLAALAKENPYQAKQAENYIKISRGLIDPNVRRFLIEKMPEFDDETAMVHYVTTLINSGDITNIVDVLSNTTKVYKGDFALLKKDHKVLMRDGVIAPMANISKEASAAIPPTVKEDVSKMLVDQTDDVMEYILNQKEFANIQASLTPNGDFNVVATELRSGARNERMTNDLRKDLVVRINEVIRAHAAIQGISRSDAAIEVLGRHASELGISLPQKEQTTTPKEQDMLTKEFIKSKEGFRSKAYQDEGGKWTIGYGFTSIDGVPVKEGDTITEEEAEFQMDKILENHQSFKSKITIPLTPYQIDALSSFEFNLGGNVWNQPRGKQMIEAINRRDFNTAAELWRTYTKVKNRKTGQYEDSQGLINRRNEETVLFTKPVQVASGD